MLNPIVLTNILYQELSPIKQWLDDKSVTEIMINPGGRVFVESNGVKSFVGELLDEGAIDTALKMVAKHARKDAKRDTSTAIVNASVGNMRVSGGLNGLDPRGAYMTIRKHQDKSKRPTLEQLIEKGMLTEDQAKTIVRLVIHEKHNCLVAGATGSGKTTLLNALLSKIPSHERVLTIEDARELELDVPNQLNLLSNPDANISAREIVKHALRQYPDRVVLGETRGDETYDVIRAFNSGHSGNITTIHADSALLALDAFEMLYQMSLPGNAQISVQTARKYIAKAVHVVIYVHRGTEIVDGVHRVVRKVTEICLVKGAANDEYDLEDIA